MTREQAINSMISHGFTVEQVGEIIKAVTDKNDLGVDLISRADAIQAMQDKAKKLTNEDTINGLCGAVAILFELPSVTPQEPKTGHWINGYTFPDGAYWKCDKCNELIKVKIPMHYCNNCGADMREVEE